MDSTSFVRNTPLRNDKAGKLRLLYQLDAVNSFPCATCGESFTIQLLIKMQVSFVCNNFSTLKFHPFAVDSIGIE